MDFRQLEYILKIAEENNITRAAEKLYISQSALNQQLLKLERELGCQLFSRSRTDWHLTRAGESKCLPISTPFSTKASETYP